MRTIEVASISRIQRTATGFKLIFTTPGVVTGWEWDPSPDTFEVSVAADVKTDQQDGKVTLPGYRGDQAILLLISARLFHKQFVRPGFLRTPAQEKP